MSVCVCVCLFVCVLLVCTGLRCSAAIVDLCKRNASVKAAAASTATACPAAARNARVCAYNASRIGVLCLYEFILLAPLPSSRTDAHNNQPSAERETHFSTDWWHHSSFIRSLARRVHSLAAAFSSILLARPKIQGYQVEVEIWKQLDDECERQLAVQQLTQHTC